MPETVELHEDGKTLVINLTGKLTKEDYEHVIPEGRLNRGPRREQWRDLNTVLPEWRVQF